MQISSRWIVALGVLAVALAALPAPSAAAASAGPSVRGIICPEVGTPGCCGPIATVRSAQTPCCAGPVAADCCPPIAGSTCCSASPCSSAISIDVTPNPASEGREATISGTLTEATSVAGHTVVLEEQLPGTAGFVAVAHTETSASGAYSFAREVTTNAKWYVQAGTVVSSTVSESVTAAIAVHSSTLRSAGGSTIALSGTIAPTHGGERVAVQILRGGQWITIARPRLDVRSSFTFSRTVRGRALERFRVELAADARNALTLSRVVTAR